MKKPVHVNPPSWIEKLLRFLLDENVAESVIGDITEKFDERTKRGRRSLATLLYILEGLSFIRLIGYAKAIRQRHRSNNFEMIGNYFLVAQRNLKKERLYSVMSVAGMTVGLASVAVIYSYIRFEVSYDSFHQHHDKIYRITSDFNDDGERVRSARTNSQVHDALFQKIAGIESVVRILPQTGLVSEDGETKFREDNFCFTDSLFFSMFSFEPIYGRLDHALDAPFSLVVTERIARRYLGKTNIIGRQLILENEETSFTFAITGVIRDLPQNSHFTADFFASFSSLAQMPYYDDGNYPPLYVYLKTNEVTSVKSLSEKILPAIARELPEFEQQQNRKYHVQPLDEIHLHSNLDSEWQANSRYVYIQALAALGLFIAFIACINFVNLSTAQAIKRGREIGVRKVFGGMKSQLALQFLTETFVHVLIAFVISLGVAELMLRFFLGAIIEKKLSLLSLLNAPSLLVATGFILLVSFLAGIYPSIYLSRLKPAAVLKGIPLKQGRDYLRQGLVTFQVVISCLLITGTLIILKQVEYFKTRDLGFNKEHVMSISLTDRYAQKNYTVLSERLLSETAVISAGLSSALPGKSGFYGWDILPEGFDQKVNIKTLGVDEGFVSTYNLTLIDGRDFSKDILTDQTGAFIINEAAAKMLGWQEPVSKELELTAYIGGRQLRKGKVIGLVKDFNFESLYQRIEPLLLYINKHPYYAENLSVRLKPGELSASIDKITNIWKDFHPDKPMEYSFIDENLERVYQSETRFSNILLAISIIAISISVLGVFSLSSYTASRRAREMSIRKVFGASSLGLLVLQYRQYFALVLLANVVTIPMCIYGSRQWFDTLPYHISLDAGIFIGTFCGTALVTLAIISFHAFRVATANPASVIRNE